MTNLRKLEGPKLESNKKTKYLVFFLHGWGAEGNDLIQLGYSWSNTLQNVTFLAPNAPEPCEANPLGKQWFPIYQEDPKVMLTGLIRATEDLTYYITSQLEYYKIESTNYFIVGFSQGTMLSLNYALQNECLGIIGYSGAYIQTILPKIIPKNEIMLIHGENDDVVPIKKMHYSIKILKELNFKVSSHISLNLGHSIDQEGIDKGKEFILQRLIK